MDLFETFSPIYSATQPFSSVKYGSKSSGVPGVSLHSAVYSRPSTTLEDNLISFLSYIKSQNIPILPVSLPDVRSVLGQGASFFVNGAELPETYTDQTTGTVLPKGLVVAFKRATMNENMADIIADRICVIFNEVLTMLHPPLLAHPNIVKLLGIGFELEGMDHVMPVLIPECAELGNLAEILETARKEDRPLDFEEKLSLCIDVAHGLEVLHACDIVHGDVKCENILIFEDDQKAENHGQHKTRLICKLTDFGVSRLPNGGLILGGSLPWQAPECSRGAYFKVENAKRTDIYSFGMMLWRVMLDGDPFKTLGKFEGETAKERRQRRNDAVARLKEEDRLVGHVCDSLEDSGKFSPPQLELLYGVVKITLNKDPTRRELDMGRVIRFLNPDSWYNQRHPVAPTRLSMGLDTQLLDIEKYYSEFQTTSAAVKSRVAKGFLAFAEELIGKNVKNERDSAAAFQLAICYAIGFGVSPQPSECLKWLGIAARGGSQRAQEALPLVAEAFGAHGEGDVGISATEITDSNEEKRPPLDLEAEPSSNEGRISIGGKGADDNWSVLHAAETCSYNIMELLLSDGIKPDMSEEGVTALHFLFSWDVDRAEKLGRDLIRAGVDVNAKAKRGASIGGTPLMWSVYGDHLEHSATLIKLGADPMAEVGGVDAISLAVQLHLTAHLRLLLENVRPAQVRGHMGRLLETAARGESRFARMTRHKGEWKRAPVEIFQFLRGWNSLFPEKVGFTDILLPALCSGMNSGFGRMNSDVQIAFIDEAGIEGSRLTELLRESVVGFNQEMFDQLLDRGVPVTGTFEGGKTLLHLCARIPDHPTAATAFAPRLLVLGADIEARDDAGYTPYMDAVLERKWDLADMLLTNGADALVANDEGYNVLGLCIKTINVGSMKYLLKYCDARKEFQQDSFIVNAKRNISALQEAALIPLPRAHGMKTEAMKAFLLTLANFQKREQVDFRSDGILPDATALEIAASKGNLLNVKNLTKMGAHITSGKRAIELAKASLSVTTEYLPRKNLERCIYILENWDTDQEGTKALADDWTNVRTIDESNVMSSWELVVWVNSFRRARLGGERTRVIK
ncbi:hypothetical protein GP486_002269 [Trichoglossum hirsutum]|uniref:Protein kinase domain-containing protein n=1 Tax=Trichoglossum hirsutum TaxID=265104 RepID=A0A9P8LEK9_9PEZI|nr:hypothetical protein GP486_002269 [Trichoglossum hirsutum]